MKAEISITGQPMGNSAIVRKLSNYTERKSGMFHSYKLTYDSVAEAKEDLRRAIKLLKRDSIEPTWHDRLSKDATHLTYDSSEAKLYKIYSNEY
jgi:hypothetical protein